MLLARPRGEDGLVPAGRAASLGRAAPFAELLAREALVPAIDRLVPFVHWITPVFAPKRFDTRFFLALAPPDQALAHDGREAVELGLDFAARGARRARQAVQAPLSDRAELVETRGPPRRSPPRAPRPSCCPKRSKSTAGRGSKSPPRPATAAKPSRCAGCFEALSRAGGAEGQGPPESGRSAAVRRLAPV